MGIIKHFSDDMPCMISDNPNFYFPSDPLDWLKDKEIYKENGWYVCYVRKEKIAMFNTLKDAKAFLTSR